MRISFLFFIALLFLPLSFAEEPTFSPGTTLGSQQNFENPDSPKRITLGQMLEDDSLLENNPTNTVKMPAISAQVVSLALMALAPFIIMLLTSFVKTVVVLSLLRQAVGAQQTPPNQVINGLALILTVYVMFPTGLAMYKNAEETINSAPPSALFSADTASLAMEVVNKTKDPLRGFLQRNSSAKHQHIFQQMAYRSFPKEYHKSLTPDNFLVLIPAFITSQLKDAFEIGVLIYLPFFVIDLVVSNILLAMGMMMMSPLTIALPLKLFLLVVLDGWTLLTQGLILTFR